VLERYRTADKWMSPPSGWCAIIRAWP